MPRPVSRLVLIALLALAACNGEDRATVDIAAIGNPAAPFERGARISGPAQLVRGATAEGLVALDEQGRVVPALADRWIVTDDGQSYIFRLREGNWPGGDRMSAESARDALRQTIASLRGTPLALDLAGIGQIRVMAGRVIELRLTSPQPDLLQLLAQPELGLTHKGRGAGPMRLDREGALAKLTPLPPEQRGMGPVSDWAERARAIHLLALPADKAIVRFDRGELEAVLGGRIEHFPLADRTGLSRGSIQIDPAIGLFGLVAQHQDGFLASPENREAVAMAIDRDRIGSSLGVSGWNATTRIVPAGLPGDLGTIGERWSGMNMEARRAEARARVARWRGGGDLPVRLRIALPRGKGADLLFALIQEDLAGAGLEAVQVAENAPADLRLLDAVARYAGAAWFLNQLNCQTVRAACSASADARAAEARTAPDAASRNALIAEAEAELTAANTYIPLGAPLRWSLVAGEATGFAANRQAYHPLMPMALRPK